MRKFNTSGPNIPEQHYTITRTDLINQAGIDFIEKEYNIEKLTQNFVVYGSMNTK